ncbi:MAG: HD domain-containing protein [Candidatus Heimdallarchaeaceae archaeon]
MVEEQGYYKYFQDLQSFKTIVKKSYNYISARMDDELYSHSMDHTLRVTSMALKLGKHLGAALDVIILASLFHDVARSIEKETGNCHAEASAKVAEQFLRENNLPALVEEVCYAIRTHRFSKNIEPETVEGKILQDADMLDAL